LRMRLGITADRLQVICTSASFQDPDYALQFGAQLTGKDPGDFDTVQGDLLLRSPASSGTRADALALAAIDLGAFYDADNDAARLPLVADFLGFRHVEQPWALQRALYDALVSFGPMGRLVNQSMTEARPLDSLAGMLFEGVEHAVAARAVTNLM